MEELAAAKASVSEVQTSSTITILMGTFIAVVLAIVSGILISSSIANPISKLQKGACEVWKGDLDYRVGTEADDEIGELSRAFDGMALNLKKSRDELEEHNQNLEEKIAERTAKLDMKIEEKVKERTVEVEKLLKHKDEFISQLGHDIKTPLTPLLPVIEQKEENPKAEGADNSLHTQRQLYQEPCCFNTPACKAQLRRCGL